MSDQTAATPSGALHIKLIKQKDKTGVSQTEISSTRPFSLPEVFIGQPPEVVATILPQLYSVCSSAHGVAAATALESASGFCSPQSLHHARQSLVAMETLREHLWRIYMGWPKFLNAPTQPDLITKINQLQSDLKKSLFGGLAAHTTNDIPLEHMDLGQAASIVEEITEHIEDQVLGNRIATWLYEDSVKFFTQWIDNADRLPAKILRFLQHNQWQKIGDTQFTPLPPLSPEAICVAFQQSAATSKELICRPTWDGKARETGPLTRQKLQPGVRDIQQQFGNGLITRIYATLYEIASLPEQLSQQIVFLRHYKKTGLLPLINSSPKNEGVGQVEAARGRLIHHLKIKQGLVDQYHVIAPTEWNFHPSGYVAQALRALDGKNGDLELMAKLVIEIVDPCVEYTLEIENHA